MEDEMNRITPEDLEFLSGSGGILQIVADDTADEERPSRRITEVHMEETKSRIEDVLYALTFEQRAGLMASEARNILTNLWPAIEREIVAERQACAEIAKSFVDAEWPNDDLSRQADSIHYEIMRRAHGSDLKTEDANAMTQALIKSVVSAERSRILQIVADEAADEERISCLCAAEALDRVAVKIDKPNP